MLKMKFFWLIFRGKFEQKTQNSIFLKNQWRLKNIKKAMVVKKIIAEDMAFTKSIFEQFWRSYCKKTIFVVFHFLKFLPKCFFNIRILQYDKRFRTSSTTVDSRSWHVEAGRLSTGSIGSPIVLAKLLINYFRRLLKVKKKWSWSCNTPLKFLWILGQSRPTAGKA